MYRLKWHSAGKKFLGWRYIPKAPIHLDIELSYACNFKCTMCPQSYDDNAKGVMDYHVARSILCEAARMGVYSIKWNWRGEATLHKQIANLTEQAKEIGIPEVQLNTNGNMRGCDVTDLIDAGIDRIIFSVDADTKETFEKIRIGGDFDELCRTIRKAVNYRNHLGLHRPFIRVQMVKQNLNSHEVEGFTNRWKGIVDDVRVSQVMDRGPDGGPLIGDLVPAGRAFCQQPFQRMVIGWDGKVFGCCGSWWETRQIGKSDSRLLDVWKKSVGLQDMRDAQSGGYQDAIEPCSNCFVKDGYVWENSRQDLIQIGNAA